MYCKELTYDDYDGVTRTEKLWFHLSKPELLELEYTTGKKFSEMLDDIFKAKNVSEIIKTFKTIILTAYGEKVDGRRFTKTDAEGHPLSRAFSETAAYEVLYMLLSSDDEEAAKFINGIVPADLREAAENAASNADTAVLATV